MRHSAFGRLLLLLVIGLSGAARAQNLLGNPAFDVGLGSSLWQVQTGTTQLVADAAHCTGSQALEATSGLSGGGDQYFFLTSQECFPVDPASQPVIYLGGDYRSSADMYSRIYLSRFSDENCNTPVGFSAILDAGSSPTWVRLLGAVTLAGDTAAVTLYVDNIPAQSGQPQFTVEWDRLYLGYEGEIFQDDFEFDGGSSCRWSSVTGGI